VNIANDFGVTLQCAVQDAAPPAGLVNHLAILLEQEIQPRIASLARRQKESDDEFVNLAQRHAARAAEKVDMLSTRLEK
jgi:hypothetical protein